MRPPLGICEPNPDPWVDPPLSTKQGRAQALCAPCPVLAQCREYARTIDGWNGVIIAGWYAPIGTNGRTFPYPGGDRDKRHPALTSAQRDAYMLAVLHGLPWWYRESVERRLVPDEDCLLWADEDGLVTGDYGYLRINAPTGRTNRPLQFRSHRVAYLHHFGAIPEGRIVYRTCGRKGCCAPAHLTLDKPQPEQPMEDT